MTAQNAFGENRLGYTGRPFFLDGQILNFRYRYYAPQLGAFITADPLGYKNQQFAASNIFTPRNFSYHNGQGGASRTARPTAVGGEGENLLLDVDLFYSRPNTAPPVPETDLFAYAGGDPVNFYDPMGLYKINMLLPKYVEGRDNRKKTGYLSLLEDNGKHIAGPYSVLGRSSNTWTKMEKGIEKRVDNPNRRRNPLFPYGDTPTGLYLVESTHEKLFPSTAYGKNPVIRMLPWGGDALEAYYNGRRGLLIHGGGTNPIFENLTSTKGCIRMHDKDIKELIQEINELKKGGDLLGTIQVKEFFN